MIPIPNHLGGSNNICWVDRGSLKFLKNCLNIKTMIDIGCGLGYQVKIAKELGINAWGIDGDPNVNPDILIDYTKKSYRPSYDIDLAWSVEFLEHVPERFINNYMETFERCRYIVCTASYFSSKRHYNVQDIDYWIRLFRENGFVYSSYLKGSVLRNSTMKPYDTGSLNSLTFLQCSGMAFYRNDIPNPFPKQISKEWPS